MEDADLTLLALLAFIRVDLDRFVCAVLGTVNNQYDAVIWPDNEADLGRQLALLGQAMQQHAIQHR